MGQLLILSFQHGCVENNPSPIAHYSIAMVRTMRTFVLLLKIIMISQNKITILQHADKIFQSVKNAVYIYIYT